MGGIEISFPLVILCGPETGEPKVLEILEVPNKVEELTARALGCLESNGLKGSSDGTKAPMDIWNETSYFEAVNSEIPEVVKCRKVGEVDCAKWFGSGASDKRVEGSEVVGHYIEPVDPWKQTELVCILKSFGLLVGRRGGSEIVV